MVGNRDLTRTFCSEPDPKLLTTILILGSSGLSGSKVSPPPPFLISTAKNNIGFSLLSDTPPPSPAPTFSHALLRLAPRVSNPD